jgi:predicted helicase
MTIAEYLEKINTRFKTGISREHTYRGDLQTLLESLVTDVLVTNEPARIACGAPDYIITKKGIPVVYIEAKDIGVDLNSKSLKEQFDRYKAALDNLIITDYLDFHFYIDGAFKTSVKIAETANGKIKPLPENFSRFETLIRDACLHIGQTIKSSKKLAEMMAAKAKMLADVIEKAIKSDEHTQENSSINDQMNAFKEILIHDITPKEFADIYAQTIAYGMFSARLHDPSLPTFTREEAAILIPKTNPFLRKLFQYIAGYDLDTRLVWIVDSLADIFRATDINALLKNFGKATQTHDPIIHFYETFLSEYDPKLRKARGVWYTPEPVVNFIVRAVDDILKTEFNLPQGLADTSKTKIKIASQNFDKKTGKYKEEEKEVHKVQILDPATGTGTFLAEVVKQIYKKFEGQQGIWSNYLENHLIPRLNGFELLMASYAMAHLKLDLLTTETGFKPTKDQRFRIYLTNSLEEHHPDTGTLFANWLSTEANEANHIKRDTPVMVVLGNPPYSVSSSNKSEWIESLTADYKKDLNERNIQPLSDDYIKFIRFGQHFIDKNGEGILAYISNNSFIDGIIHRQMRKNLLESFDKVYVLNLHGNSRIKEVSPDGSKDENVFDIMQGVSINLFIKTGIKKKNEIGKAFYYDIYGKRELKYHFLECNSLKSLIWDEVKVKEPNYYFKIKNEIGFTKYEEGFRINNLFPVFSNGFTTERDDITLHFNFQTLNQTVVDLINLPEGEFKSKYSLKPDGRDWTYRTAKSDITNNKKNFVNALYRPFDLRATCYTGKTKGFYSFPRNEVLHNLLTKNNIALIIPKQTKDTLGGFVSKNIAGHKSFSAYDKSSVFPLYLYPSATNQQSINATIARTPNLNPEIVKQIANHLGFAFTNEKEEQTEGEVCFANSPEVRPEFRATFAPIDILDYIYAVLHSPTYREKYKEFLKIDFPRVPYPKDAATFWKLVALGGELRQIHLLESPEVEKFITQYPVDGNNKVEKIKYEDKKVFINETQYFDNVPPVAWEFYIGGYQPAQKWLKDRKGRELTFDDILHYQKIIVALTETDQIMKKIDKIKIEG